MTLLTDKPAAGGQPPAPPASTGAPSSGAPAAKPGEQQAAGKEPAAPAAPAADAAGKAAVDNGGGEPAEGDKAGEKKPADKSRYYGAPETYQFKPSEDGATVGEKVGAAFSEVARELNLSNEAAQVLVDKVSPALRAQTAANLTAMVDGFVKDTNADPEIGGEKLKETLSFARRALDLAPPELRQLLGPLSEGGTGLGNHKAIIKWAANIGRKLSPDTKVVTGTEVTPPPKTPEERLAGTYAPLKGS